MANLYRLQLGLQLFRLLTFHDIGEFVRHYPNGKSIAKRLGAKDAIMRLLDHENIDLQRHALHSISKMMVQNWAVSILFLRQSLLEKTLFIIFP